MTETVTLNQIREQLPCEDGWKKLLAHLGKTKADAEPFSPAVVLESNGMADALWMLDNCIDPHLCRLFAADCAESVLPNFEREHPDDDRPRKALEVVRNRNATDGERSAANSAANRAAWSAANSAANSAAWRAAWSAANSAAWSATRRAAWSAARSAASSAARSAASSAADGATWGAARSAASSAADGATWGAADGAARNAARKAQNARLRQYLEHGEAAKDMPWPEAD